MTKRPLQNTLSLDDSIGDVCFVAMDFSRKFNPVYEEILEPTIADCGMRPSRGDLIFSGRGNILNDVEKAIRTSRIVVIDLTGGNSNVMIETGMALANKRPIAFISQDDTIPFNIQPRRVIRYDMSDDGKARLRKDLAAKLNTAVYPSESTLRDMLDRVDKHPTYIIYGHVSAHHIKAVSPPVDTAYWGRLQKMSSETTGIGDIALAYQKISWSAGKDPVTLVATDGRRAPKDLLQHGNAFIFGGPAANPFFSVLVKKICAIYRNSLTMLSVRGAGGRKRFRIYKQGTVYPQEQDELLSQDIDVGLVMRFPNPFLRGATIWMAAGIRSFGTEAAIKTITTPSLISKIKRKVGIQRSDVGFWAVVKARYDQESQELRETTVHDSGRLDPA